MPYHAPPTPLRLYTHHTHTTHMPPLSHHIHTPPPSSHTGVMGVGGNKGAVVVRFELGHSSFCFVNTHLAAHKHNIQGRNSNFHTIIQRTRLSPVPGLMATASSPPSPSSPPSSSSPSPPSSPSFPSSGGPGLGPAIFENYVNYSADADSTSGRSLSWPLERRALAIYDHDLVFWLGDLNYRLNMTSLSRCYSYLSKHSHSSTHPTSSRHELAHLLKYDQLLHEKREGKAFSAFEELPITFPPTYKYIPGKGRHAV